MTFTDGLCLVFIALKLSGNIDWNWFWVVSPIILKALIVATINVIRENNNKSPISSFKF